MQNESKSERADNMNTLSYALASAAGLNYNSQTGICFGSVEGYNVSALCINQSAAYGVSRDNTTVYLFFPVTAVGQPLSAELFAALVHTSENIKSVTVKDYSLHVLCNTAKKSEQESVAIALSAIKEAVAFFQCSNFSPCCAGCGSTDKNTNCYSVGGDPSCLCDECAEKKNAQLHEKKPAKSGKDILLGILGALLFSCIGIVLMLLFRNLMFGNVSMIPLGAGALGVCAMIGYTKFGKGMRNAEKFIPLVLSLILVWFTYQATYAIELSKYLNTGFGEAYRYILGVLPSDYLNETDEYWSALIGSIIVCCIASLLYSMTHTSIKAKLQEMYRL